MQVERIPLALHLGYGSDDAERERLCRAGTGRGSYDGAVCTIRNNAAIVVLPVPGPGIAAILRRYNCVPELRTRTVIDADVDLLRPGGIELNSPLTKSAWRDSLCI